MAIATLSIDIEARLASFEQQMAKATAVVDKSAQQMESSFGALGKKLGGALAGLSIAALALEMKDLFKATALGIDALNDMADATGASVENISALEDVAARTGTKIEAVSTALVKFNTVLIEAQKPGSDAALVLERLGLNAEELRRLDPAEALLRTAQALAKFADDGDKARVIQVLFGKATREIAPLLKDLAETSKLTATVMSEQAQEAEKFSHHLSRMAKQAQDTGRSIVNFLLPAINAVLDKQKEKGWLATLFGSSSSELFKPGVVDTSNYSNEGRNKPKIGAIPQKPAGGAGMSDAEKYLESLDRQVEQSLDLTAQERVLYDLANGRLKLTNGITEEQLLLRAGIVDKLKEEAKWQDAVNKAAREAADARNKEYDAAIAAANANIKADADRLRGILDKTPQGVFNKQQQDIDFLQRKLDQGDIDITQYGEAVKVVFGFAEEGVKKTKSLAEELGMTFSSAFEDAIVGGKGLSGVLKGLEQDILRIITRKMITEPLGNWITGAIGGSGGGDIFGKMGGWLSSLFAGGFATGGYIPPGKWGMTGERGPEPIFGGRSGVTVHPASTGSVVINLSVQGPVSSATQQQLAAAAARGLQLAQMRGT